MFRWGRVSVAYAAVAALALLIGHSVGRDSLFAYPGPWLALSGLEAHAFSIALGLCFAGLVVVGTRISVAHAAWAKNLHRDLRPIAYKLDATGVLVIAGFSAVAEELVFRGVLTPWIGLFPQAILF